MIAREGEAVIKELRVNDWRKQDPYQNWSWSLIRDTM